MVMYRQTKSNKLENRHHSSEPKENNTNEYDKENIDFQILSPQPQKCSFLPRIQRSRDTDK